MRLLSLAAPTAFVLAALVLSACSPSAEDSEGLDPAPPAPPPVLAGIDLTRPLHVGGTEPFWAVEMTGRELVYSGLDRPEQRAPQGQPVMQGTMAIWEAATTAGNPIKISLTATDCSDGMSDRTYPLTAMVEISGETLMGCAATVTAITAAGESGRVVDGAQPAG